MQGPSVLSLPQPWNYPNFQGAQVPFGGDWYLDIKIWVLSGLLAIGDISVPKPSQWTQLEKHIYMCTHYLYFCIFISILKVMSSHQYFQILSNTKVCSV